MASYLPTTHFYIPRIEQRESNLFMEEYYSSTDTKIYVDGLEDSEIGYISYSVQEQLKPLYGYASRTFDDMAVGNRIITGMFKVPIRNPESQTSFKDILESLDETSDSNANEDYNKKQEELLNLKEWIESGDIITSENYIENNEIYLYVTKLEALGYDIDASATMGQIIDILKKFQNEEDGLEVTGMLDTQTKTRIDEKLRDSSLPIVKLKSGALVYNGPAKMWGERKTLASESQALVINTLDGWLHVQFEDGTEGYIEEDDVVKEEV